MSAASFRVSWINFLLLPSNPFMLNLPIRILIHAPYLSTANAIRKYVKTLPNSHRARRPPLGLNSVGKDISEGSSPFHAAGEFGHLHRTAHDDGCALMDALGLNIKDATCAIAGAPTGLLGQESDRIDLIKQA